MELNTHYELDDSFAGFDLSLVTFDNKAVLYDGVRVVRDDGAKIIQPGCSIQGRKISTQQAISLWQHCYVATRESYDPEQCARVYRNVNGVCHTCCGDTTITRWIKDPATRKRVAKDFECKDCEGSGTSTEIQAEAKWNSSSHS